jgi:RNA polymerase sigma-70 factor (ECF subfamily)
VAQLFAGLGRQGAALGLTYEPHEVNGQPGAVVRDREGRVVSVFALDIAEGLVQTIRSVINPDKLHHLGQVADAYALAREAGRRRPT